MPIDHLIFVGFNSRVAAIDRKTGIIVWQWRCPSPKTGGYVTLLLEPDLLTVSVNGYLYGLDPATGEQYWHNDTKGFGTGVASLVSMRGGSAHSANLQAAQQIAARAAAAAGASAAH
jgi:outer membrane protein assembly factor BamB